MLPDHVIAQIASLIAPGRTPHLRLLNLPDPALLARTLVPLTAFLLEYPVAYTLDASPQSNPANCLGGRALNVIRVWLRAPAPIAPHLLMSFSTPADLSLPVSLGTMTDSIQRKIEDRLQMGRRQELTIQWNEVVVEVERGVVLDRVAL